MFIEKGFTVKESKECGTGGNMALLTMARYLHHTKIQINKNKISSIWSSTMQLRCLQLQSRHTTLGLYVCVYVSLSQICDNDYHHAHTH